MSKFKKGDRVNYNKEILKDLQLDEYIKIVSRVEDNRVYYVGGGHDLASSLVLINTTTEEPTIKDVTVHKLTEKKTLGYRCTTNDYVTFESDKSKGLLKIYATGDVHGVTLDITPHTLELLSEFIRYIKTDNE